MNQFGWVFFGFGLCFYWLFGGTQTLQELVYFNGQLEMVSGTITRIERTDTSINERRLFEYSYSFSIDGVPQKSSFLQYEGYRRVGDSVEVEYPLDFPKRSRANVASAFGASSRLTLVLPGVGLVMISSGIRKGIKGGKLLQNGKLGWGKLINRAPTQTSVNDQTVYLYTFEFKADDGNRYEAKARTHLYEPFAGERGEAPPSNDYGQGDTVEPLLYLTHQPQQAILLDDLPGGPRIDEHGQIQIHTNSYIGLLLPTIVLCGHGYWIIHTLNQ